MEEDKTLYLSGPIGNGGKCTPEQQLQNVINGMILKGKLMAKGYAVFCPQLSYYSDKYWRDNNMKECEFDHDDWMRVDRQWVRKCKYFFYMTPEIYGESKGAKIELGWAKQWGKKIFTSLEEVPSKHEIQI